MEHKEPTQKVLQTIARMQEYVPTPWALIPDLGLYKDQVITYIERQYEPLYGAASKDIITPSMINNYVKAGTIQPPVKKKYYREQLAMLTMLVTLKQCASIDDITKLMCAPSGGNVQQVYETFSNAHVAALREYSGMVAEGRVSALELAIGASAGMLACEAMMGR